MAEYNTESLVAKIESCAVGVFASSRFGKLSEINFDHDINYGPDGLDIRNDLLNIDYPTSTITDVGHNKHVYQFDLMAARLIKQDDTDTNQHKFADLETKMWKILQCLSICDIIVLPNVNVIREVGTFNDKLLTIDFNVQLEVYSYCINPPC
jgi:hypothetical protein